MGVLPARREERPAGCDVTTGLAVKHAGEIAHVAPALRFNPQRDGQAGFGVAVGDDCGDAGKGVAGEFLEAAPEPLRLQLGQVFHHGLHVSSRRGRCPVPRLLRRGGAAGP